MSENQGTPVQGKQMGIAGFVLALVTLVFAGAIAVMAAASIALGGSPWLMYLWLVLAIVGMVLSIMAMGKLKKTGGKRGLAIAGMVIGIVSVVYCIILVLGLAAASSMQGEIQDALSESEEWQDAIEQYEENK